jgi:hypothetical protein
MKIKLELITRARAFLLLLELGVGRFKLTIKAEA